MPEYQPPALREIRQEDFLRVQDKLYTSVGGWPLLGHSGLAKEAGLPEDAVKFAAIMKANPDDYDSGEYVSTGKNEIIVFGYSDSLQLPVSIKARTQSGILFQHLSPEHVVNPPEDPGVFPLLCG